jgi:hypothetical protein
LVYRVVTSLGIGVVWHLGISPDHPQVEPIFTWVGPLVMLFASLVPNSTGKILIAGLVSASMVPVGMLVWRRAGVGHLGAASDALLMHYPDFMLVGIAVVIGRVVTGLGQQVAKARELGATSWASCSAKEAWARSTAPPIACWRAPPPSS